MTSTPPRDGSDRAIFPSTHTAQTDEEAVMSHDIKVEDIEFVHKQIR